jgi:hypothetical protein
MLTPCVSNNKNGNIKWFQHWNVWISAWQYMMHTHMQPMQWNISRLGIHPFTSLVSFCTSCWSSCHVLLWSESFFHRLWISSKEVVRLGDIPVIQKSLPAWNHRACRWLQQWICEPSPWHHPRSLCICSEQTKSCIDAMRDSDSFARVPKREPNFKRNPKNKVIESKASDYNHVLNIENYYP